MRKVKAVFTRGIGAGLAAALVVQSLILPPTALGAAPAQPPESKQLTRVELPEKRTEQSRTFRVSDGTFAAEVFAAPIHFRDAKTGRFEPIDAALEQTMTAAGPGWKSRRNAFDLEIPRAGGRGSTRMVSGSRELSWRPVSRPERDVAPAIESTGEIVSGAAGRTVKWRDAYPHGRLEAESKAGGVKESIVLDRFTGVSTFSFDVAGKGLRPRLEASGSISWLDSVNGTETVYVMPAPWMADSNVEGDEELPCISNDVRYELTPQGDGWRLDVMADEGWLADPARVYPVTIDPTVTFTRYADQCGWYYSSGPNGSYTDTHDGVYHKVCFGYKNAAGYGTFFSLIRLGGLHAGSWWDQAADAGAQIVSARLKLYCFYDYNSAADDWAQVRGVASYWTQGTATYNNQPLYDAGVLDSLQNRSGQWMDFNVTGKVTQWVADHGEGAYGFRIQAVGGSSYAKYESAWGDYPDIKPRLEITYTVPELSVSGYEPTYRIGDTVTVTAAATSQLPGAVDELLLLPSYTFSEPARYGGYLKWSTTNPGPGWATYPAAGGGYVSAWLGSDYGNDHIELVPEACSSQLTGTARLATFAFRILDGYPTDQTTTMDANYHTALGHAGWQRGPTTVSVLPSPAMMGAPSIAARGLAWHDAASGVADTGTAGRGAIDLAWGSAGLTTQGYRVYLHDGNTWRSVATTTGTAWTSEGGRLYPSDTQISQLPTATADNPFLSGAGLDLRDDPTPLYAKTAGGARDAEQAYLLKVAPWGGCGEVPLSECPTLTVQLPCRTLDAGEPPADTTADLGTWAGNAAAAVLDSRTNDAARLELAATDLAIASFGPAAAISRTYRSDATSTSGGFGPGWRFSFGSRIQADEAGATWIDGEGRATRFSRVGEDYRAPRGVVATLALDNDPDFGWKLERKGGEVTRFRSDGRLESETDAWGREVAYGWPQDALSITAANGQRIDVSFDGTRVASATFLDRVVAYSAEGGVCSVDAYRGTSASSTVTYGYDASSRLTQVGVGGFAAPDGSLASWAIDYAGAAPVQVHLPGFATDEHRRMDLDWGADGTSATLTRYGQVGVADGTAVAQTWAWHPTGLPASVTNPGSSAEITRYDYDPFGVETRCQSPTGRVTSRATDSRGNITDEWDEAGRRTVTRYIGDDAVEQTDPNGSVTTRAFEHGDVVTEEKTLDAGGRRSRTEYSYEDTRGLLTQKRSLIATGTWATTTYADFAESGEPRTTTEMGVRLSAEADPVEVVITREIDAYGTVVKESGPHVAGQQAAWATSCTVDVAGRVIAAEDASGVVTRTTFDAAGNAASVWRSREDTAATVDRVLRCFDGAGRLLIERRLDADGAEVSRVTHTYDAMDREVASDDSMVPGYAESRFDVAGNVTESWAEGADRSKTLSSTRAETNAEGEQVSSLSPGAATASTETSYNPDGSVASEQRPDDSSVTYGYDGAGDLASETQPTEAGDAETTYETDLDGNTVQTTSPQQVVTTTDYDLLGRAVATRAGTQTMTTTTYNTLGWVLATTDFDGVGKAFAYDASGRVIRDEIGGLVTTSAFDACGRELARTNPDGSSVTTHYDVFGRVSRVVQKASDGDATSDLRTTLDEAGRPVRIEDAVSGLVRAWAYAPAGGWTMMEARPNQGTVTSTVDGTGLLVDVQAELLGAHADWSVTETDAAGRVTDAASDTFTHDWGLTYDDAGRPVTAAAARQTGTPSGYWGLYGWQALGMVVAGVGPNGTTYAYSPVSGAKSAESFGFDCPAVASETTTYTYTLTGRLGSATRNGATTTWDHDPVSGALVAYQRPNESTVTLDYDENGRLERAGTRHYRSDDLGRRIGSGPSLATTDTTYTWTGERLTGFETPGVSAAYRYDAAGQRARSVVASASLTTTTTWLYDGITLLGCTAQCSDGTTWAVSYLRDERGSVFAGVYAGTGAAPARFLIVTTDRGDVRELIDEQGAAFAHYAYDPYGNPTLTKSARTALIDTATVEAVTARQPLRYASYTWDAESGLYYCSQRYFDPAVAAFISKDPARADGEESAYQYCGGDPVGKVDPSGLRKSSLSRSQRARGKELSVNQNTIDGEPGVGGGVVGAFLTVEWEVRVSWRSVSEGTISLRYTAKQPVNAPELRKLVVQAWAQSKIGGAWRSLGTRTRRTYPNGSARWSLRRAGAGGWPVRLKVKATLWGRYDDDGYYGVPSGNEGLVSFANPYLTTAQLRPTYARR